MAHPDLLRPPVFDRRHSDGSLRWHMETWQPAGQGCWVTRWYTSWRYGKHGVVAVDDSFRVRHVRAAGAWPRRCACEDGRSGPCRHTAIADAHAAREETA